MEYDKSFGEILKVDSIVLDKAGNTLSRIYKGPYLWSSEKRYVYDSLNRLVEETERSDFFDRKVITYEERPEDKMVIKSVWDVDRSDLEGQLDSKVTIEYNDELTKIIKETHCWTFPQDTSVYLYDYESDRILRELLKPDEVMTEYSYDNGILNSIKSFAPEYSRTDYISQQTGLLDSTVTIKSGNLKVKYYRYFK